MASVIREDIIKLVQKSVQTVNSIENADRHLSGLQALTMMKRDLACNRIIEALHKYQVMLNTATELAQNEVAAFVKAREEQLTERRSSLLSAKSALLEKLQETKTVIMAGTGLTDIEKIVQVRNQLKQLVEVDYLPEQWEMFGSLEFVTRTELSDISLGYLKTSPVDPYQMSLVIDDLHRMVEVGQQVEILIKNEEDFGGLWEKHMQVCIQNPVGNTIKHKLLKAEESPNILKLLFEVDMQGPHNIDVKAYNVDINPCPLTIWALDSQHDIKANVKSPTGKHDPLAEFLPDSPNSSSLSHISRCYGPRAVRRMQGERFMFDTPPGEDNVAEIVSGVHNIHLCKGKLEPESLGSPLVIQPKSETPVKSSCRGAFSAKVPTNYELAPTCTTFIKDVQSSKPNIQPFNINRPAEVVDLVTPSKTISSIAATEYISPAKSRQDDLQNKVSSSITQNSGDGPANVKEIPLPPEPWLRSDKDVDPNPNLERSANSQKTKSCSLAKLAKRRAGKDISTEFVTSIGQRGSGSPYHFQFPIGLTTTKHQEGCFPDIISCDTGNNIVKVFTWGGTHKFTIGNDKQGYGFKRPSSVATNESGEIFIKDDRLIQKFSSNGAFLMPIGLKVLQKPYGLKLADGGRLVTLDHRLKRIAVFDEVTGENLQLIQFAPLEAQEARFRFMALHQDKIIAVNLGQHEVIVACLNTGHVLTKFGTIGHGPGQFNEPSGVTTDTYGNILVADSRNNRIQVFDGQGNFLAKLLLHERIVRPSDIHLTEEGYLLIDSYLQHTIKVFALG